MRSHDPYSDPSGCQNKWNLVANVHLGDHLDSVRVSRLCLSQRAEVEVEGWGIDRSSDAMKFYFNKRHTFPGLVWHKNQLLLFNFSSILDRIVAL